MPIKEEKPLVTVIALCYNQAQFVVETLDSIKAQTYPDIQLIIIDDCSVDNSTEIIQRWIDENNIDCEFIKHSKNQGVSKSCNDGLGRVRGEYYQVIACDDVMLPDKIDTQVKILRNSSRNVAIVYSDAYLIDENDGNYLGQFIFLHRLWRYYPSGNIYSDLIEGNFIPIMTTLIRSDIARRIGGYDEKLKFEDFDFLLRIAKEYEILFDNYISANYRIHSKNLHLAHKDTAYIDYYWIYNKHSAVPEAQKRKFKIAYNLLKENKRSNPVFKHFLKSKGFNAHSKWLQFAASNNIFFSIYTFISQILK